MICDFHVFLSAEVTANMSASEETLSWLLDIIENDPDPYVRSVQHSHILSVCEYAVDFGNPFFGFY